MGILIIILSSVQIRPDGKILVGGDLISYNGVYKNSLFYLTMEHSTMNLH